MLPVVTDTALDEEDDICTPQLHSTQISNSLSSASIHGWSRLPCPFGSIIHVHVDCNILLGGDGIITKTLDEEIPHHVCCFISPSDGPLLMG